MDKRGLHKLMISSFVLVVVILLVFLSFKADIVVSQEGSQQECGTHFYDELLGGVSLSEGRQRAIVRVPGVSPLCSSGIEACEAIGRGSCEYLETKQTRDGTWTRMPGSCQDATADQNVYISAVCGAARSEEEYKDASKTKINERDVIFYVVDSKGKGIADAEIKIEGAHEVYSGELIGRSDTLYLKTRGNGKTPPIKLRTEENYFITIGKIGYQQIETYAIVKEGSGTLALGPYDIGDKFLSTGKCVELIEGQNKLEDNRLNIIFSLYGYSSSEEILSELKTQATTLLNTKPFSEERKLNFWIVENVEDIKLCKEKYMIPFIGSSQYLSCPTKLAETCGLKNRYIITISNDISIGKNYRARSLYYLKDAPIFIHQSDLNRNTNLYQNYLIAHEFGHALGKLHDEYVEKSTAQGFFNSFPNPFPLSGPNCYSNILWASKAQCLKNAPWKNQIGNGCGKDGVIDCAVIEIKQSDCTFDVDADGKFNYTTDNAKIRSILFDGVTPKKCKINGKEQLRGDINKDGKVDYTDDRRMWLFETYGEVRICSDGTENCFYEVGCYAGCFYFRIGSYRPTLCSIMGGRGVPECYAINKIVPQKYGEVDENVLRTKLKKL